MSTPLPTVGRRCGAMKDISNENGDAISLKFPGPINLATLATPGSGPGDSLMLIANVAKGLRL